MALAKGWLQLLYFCLNQACSRLPGHAPELWSELDIPALFDHPPTMKERLRAGFRRRRSHSPKSISYHCTTVRAGCGRLRGYRLED
jgi:hypothetical protein